MSGKEWRRAVEMYTAVPIVGSGDVNVNEDFGQNGVFGKSEHSVGREMDTNCKTELNLLTSGKAHARACSEDVVVDCFVALNCLMQENRFGEIELVGDFLLLVLGKIVAMEQRDTDDCKSVAAERRRSEYVEDCKWELHILFLSSFCGV